MVVQQARPEAQSKSLKKSAKQYDDEDEILPLHGEEEGLALKMVENLFLRSMARETNLITFQARKKKVERVAMKEAGKAVLAKNNPENEDDQ